MKLPVAPLALVLLAGCASAYKPPSDDKGPKPEHRVGAPEFTATVDPNRASPMGWAAVDALGQNGTTGGGELTPTDVSTLEELIAVMTDAAPRVARLLAPVTGSIKIGSNKTLLGSANAVFTGHIGVQGSFNVIVKNLKIVGYNCTDNPDCEAGADAVTIDRAAHHVWFDHCDVSDGSDGNLDIASAADYVTISWTKFGYTPGRPGGHQYSNLIGSSDNSMGDAGHLRVTFHHDWWTQNVNQRMPRARYGLVHVFNNLYTPTDSLYCIGLGYYANILTESNSFVGPRIAFDTAKYSNGESVAASYGNLYDASTLGALDVHLEKSFTPPYDYELQPADAIEATVMAHAGPLPE
jgi:pectate lyase